MRENAKGGPLLCLIWGTLGNTMFHICPVWMYIAVWIGRFCSCVLSRRYDSNHF